MDSAVQIIIIERGAYGSTSDRFNAVRAGEVIGGGMHHKGPYRNEWVDVLNGYRATTKAALLAHYA